MQPFAVLSPILFAVFIWWFSTGIIMIAYNRPRWLVRVFFGCITLVLGVALAGLVLTRSDASVEAVYIAVACGVTIWGWQVASYYLDFVTGTNKTVTQPALSQRFWVALRASIHHEILAAAFAVVMAALVWSSPNKWALWTYLTLWIMHSSAKLNVFFGVRNFRIEFLPSHMQHLGALLERRPYNWFFFGSVSWACSITLALLYRAIVPPVEPTQFAGTFMMITLMVLGIIEHLMLVVPLPATLWGWGIRTLPEPVPIKSRSLENRQMMKGPSQ